MYFCCMKIIYKQVSTNHINHTKGVEMRKSATPDTVQDAYVQTKQKRQKLKKNFRRQQLCAQQIQF